MAKEKNTQWHPMAGDLLNRTLGREYQLGPEQPVGDLPKRADFVLERREGVELPVSGIWDHLERLNAFEFKGVTDDPEYEDLDLLMHVGTGITLRVNEDRQKNDKPPYPANETTFWFLAPNLGEKFMDQVRTRVPTLEFEDVGFWRGKSWGRKMFFLAYREVPVREDTLLFHLLLRKDEKPRQAVRALFARQPRLRQEYGNWLVVHQPQFWKEICAMSDSESQFPEPDPVLSVQCLMDVYGPARVAQAVPAENVQALVAGLPADKLQSAVAGLPADKLQSAVAGLPADKLLSAVAGLPADKLQALAETIRQLLAASGQPPASGQ